MQVKKGTGSFIMKLGVVLILVGYLIQTQYEDHKTRRFVVIPKPGIVQPMGMVKKALDLKKLRFQDAYLVYESKAGLRKNEKVLSGFTVEEDIVYTTDMSCGSPTPPKPPQNPEQPAENEDWGTKRIHAREANLIADSKDVLICSIDTGIDRNHPDLKGIYAIGINFTDQGSTSDVTDYVGHGTHTIGTMAAIRGNGIGVSGVTRSKVAVCKALTERGGYSSWIADCVTWCQRQAARVINMSLGSTQSSTVIYNAIKAYTDAGGIVVAAAGNDGGMTGFPARYNEVIAVSALNQSDRLTSWSSRGKVNYSAPGENIISTMPGGNYGPMSGTSMASPHVAGVVALALSRDKPIIQADPIGPQDMYGLGIVNALRTVE